jgi:signal peptidase I
VAKKEKDEKPRETTVEFLASLAGVLVTGLFIITFILQAFEIPSGSMVKTLLVGDHVFVNRVQFSPPSKWLGPLVPYGEIHRGDIVVFLSVDPRTPELYIVKRIMGLPGDRIHLRNGVVYRNGQKLEEPYAIHSDLGAVGSEYPYRDYRDNFPAVSAGDQPNVIDDWKLTMADHVENGDIVVPPNSYFGMGDNRDVSLDSRYWGFIPRENVIGRPMFIYWSFDTPEDQYQQRGFGQRLAFLGHVIIHFFDETRWKRTLNFVK